jgi:hypothetical protein
MTKTVAILGASTDPAKYGNKSVRAHARQGWEVYPVNPKAEEIEGHKCYASLSAIPVRIDRVSMYLPPKVGLTMLEEIREKEPAEFFLNPGSESEELVEKAEAMGLHPILACSIVDIGARPSEFPG